MIICSSNSIHIVSRLFTFVCLLLITLVVKPKSVVAIDETSTEINLISTTTWNNSLSVRDVNQSINVSIVNETCQPDPVDTSWSSSLAYRIFAGALIIPITFCAISGNILVIYVIKHFRALRVTGNVFLASLAVADVGVSTLAMTFYGLQLMQGKWILGAFMCRLWFSCDVLFSTASIMHLACIALDRYLSIVRPFHNDGRSAKRRRNAMIFGCWFGSALLSFIPIFTGIYTTTEHNKKISCLNRVTGRCIFAVNQAYAIVSSSFSFWVPSAVMIVMYALLIKIADKKEREAFHQADSVAFRRRISESAAQSHARRKSSEEQNSSDRPNPPKTKKTNGFQHHPRRSCKHDSIDAQMEQRDSGDGSVSFLDPRRNSQMRFLRRERRAVKTLGAIMLAFLICWLPFFVRYSACEPDRCLWPFMKIVEDLVFWIGYFNSMINPFLYAFHNKDFHNAFQRTLSRYFVCFRQRRTSSSSLIPYSPATPSGELNRKNFKKHKDRSPLKSNIIETQRESIKNGTHWQMNTEIIDKTMNNGENSISSKPNSIV